MKRWMMALGTGLGLLMLFGCVTTTSAPKTASGHPIKLAVLSDRGDPNEMESKQWGYRNEVGSYMEEDLLRRLNRAGYDAKLIDSASEYTSAPDSYLLKMEITSYNPGSSAARIFVGYGAGACSLDMRYTVKKGGQVVEQWEDGIGTSMDWHRLPNALNEKLVNRLNAEILTW